MSRSTRTLIRSLNGIPGLYPLLAFLTARRVAVRGWSMQPTLSPGERVLFDRLAYQAAAPGRGDIVLAVHPARPRIRMIKRVAGVPGDSVPRGPGGPLTGTSRGRDDPAGRLYTAEPAALGRDEYWLLGDAGDASTDSRQLGPFRRRDILARAWLVYWPPERWRRL